MTDPTITITAMAIAIRLKSSEAAAARKSMLGKPIPFTSTRDAASHAAPLPSEPSCRAPSHAAATRATGRCKVKTTGTAIGGFNSILIGTDVVEFLSVPYSGRMLNESAIAGTTAGSALHQTSRGSLVLLFYDGFEWRARSGLIGKTRAQARRLARFLYRTIRRKQVRTGFYTAFVALRTALERAGCDVRVNDFATAAAMPDYPIGIAGYPSVLDAVRLPNPAIFGPGDYGAPPEAHAVAAEPQLKLLIQPSDWFRDYYRPSCGDKMVTWFAGIDTKRWSPATSRDKSVDVLIYDKIRWDRDINVPAILDRLTAHLDAEGLSYRVLRYGHHHQKAFREGLRVARSLAFLCEHETQGLAYQEAMAADVAVFAWDEGVFVDPQLNRHALPGLAVSSVPYFDDRCGMRFTLAAMEVRFDDFWARRDGFTPRAYVEECLSLERSADLYLALYARAGAGRP